VDKIGIDLGGTKIEGILLTRDSQVVDRKRIPTNQEQGYSSILESVITLVNELKKKSNEKPTIGICTPGIISEKTGLLTNSNTQCMIGKSLRRDLEKSLNQKISIENDANCFAMAEAKMGAGKIFGLVFGVIIGTGVGGGIIFNGKLLSGTNHIAGEWGHHTIRTDGNVCYCGKRGCVETYLSGPSLEKRWLELTGKNDSLELIVKNHSEKNYYLWKKEFLENFGVSLANVINILDPDVIVLGGGVSNISFLFDEGRKFVYKNVFSDIAKTPILKNNLGDSAGVFGAALLNG